MAKKNPLAKYESLAEGSNLATALGRTGAASRFDTRMQNLLSKNPGLDTSGLDIQGFSNWEDLGPGTADQAIKALTRQRKRGLEKRGVKDPGKATNRFKVGLNTSLEGLMKRGAQEELDAPLEEIQNRAMQNIDEAAISATEEQSLASRIASMVRTRESTAMSSLGTALGFGNMASSPAALALANEISEGAGQEIVSSIRDLGIEVNAVNREQQRRDLDLATQIADARWRLLNGNSESLISMRGEVAALQDALYSRDRTLDIYERQVRDAGEMSGWEKFSLGAGGLADLGKAYYNVKGAGTSTGA